MLFKIILFKYENRFLWEICVLIDLCLVLLGSNFTDLL